MRVDNNVAEARKHAQENANSSGVPWVMFLDTCGNLNIERMGRINFSHEIFYPQKTLTAGDKLYRCWLPAHGCIREVTFVKLCDDDKDWYIIADGTGKELAVYGKDYAPTKLQALGQLLATYNDDLKRFETERHQAQNKIDYTTSLINQIQNVMILHQPSRCLVVDGHSKADGCFMGDGESPPFVVFDVDQQEIIAGPFQTRGGAETHRVEILSGKKPRFDKAYLNVMITNLDKNK